MIIDQVARETKQQDRGTRTASLSSLQRHRARRNRAKSNADRFSREGLEIYARAIILEHVTGRATRRAGMYIAGQPVGSMLTRGQSTQPAPRAKTAPARMLVTDSSSINATSSFI